MSLPTDPKARKGIPLYSGLLKYFPDALCAVAEVSRIGNDQHHKGEPLHWDRSKSMDQHDCLMRHLLESGSTDTDGVRHSAKLAWRSLALLQLEIEKEIEDARKTEIPVVQVPEPVQNQSDRTWHVVTRCESGGNCR